MAWKDSVQFTEREKTLALFALQCMSLQDVQFDLNRFQELGGMGTRASANTSWYNLKKKLASGKPAAVNPPAKPTPKKGGKKGVVKDEAAMSIQPSEEAGSGGEGDVYSWASINKPQTKSRPARKRKAAVTEEQNDEDAASPVKRVRTGREAGAVVKAEPVDEIVSGAALFEELEEAAAGSEE